MRKRGLDHVEHREDVGLEGALQLLFGDFGDVLVGMLVGDDLAQGKVTLPLIRAMACAKEPDRLLVRKAIKDGGRVALPEIVRIVHETGALDYVKQRAEVEADAAKFALNAFPNSNFRECLLKLCEFAVARTY